MNRYKTTYLKEENLLTLLSQNTFIIPEIQRDYVWGNNKNVIRKFLFQIREKAGILCKECKQPTSKEKINVGFLYSYKPHYVKVKHDRLLDENLIDGQQRFTTLFLLLFYCAINENRQKEFKNLIRFEERLHMNFDFRVRDLTKNFLFDFIHKMDSIKNKKNIQQRTWFLEDYKNDKSIDSMLSAWDEIEEVFPNKSDHYYDYFLNHIVFWHFKTEATSEGENLYITMNARGERLMNNELEKANLLDDTKLFEQGKDWERWQQFFWKNRKKGNKKVFNADYGFNEFLRWCDELYDIIGNNETKFNFIKKLFTSIEYLVELQYEPIPHGGENIYLEQVLNFQEKIQPEQRESKFPLIEAKDKLVIYAALRYISIRNEKEIDLLYLYRLLRIIRNSAKYLSDYYLYERKQKGIEYALALSEKRRDDIIELANDKENPEKHILQEEEKEKLRIYQANHENRETIEKIFWEIEDHSFFNFSIKNIIRLCYEKDDNKFDLNRLNKIYKILNDKLLKNDARSMDDKFRFALLSLEQNLSHVSVFKEGVSLDLDRFNLGAERESWNKIVQSEIFIMLLDYLYNEKDLDEIINIGLSNEKNDHVKKVKEKIINQVRNYHQWRNHKRFMFDDKKLYFPNGVQAKSNKGELEIYSNN
jgi:hypothetical protein